MSKLSRRDFFKVASVGAAGIALSNPFQAFAATTKKVAPSDTVRVVGIGCGPQGRTVHGGFNSLDDCQVVAVCDVHDRKSAAAAERFTDAKGKPVPTYHDFRTMLDDKKLQFDAALITTPDHWHCLIGVACCQAGKDIYVEKPLAFTVYEGEQLKKAVRKYSRMMQTGSMQRSMGTFQALTDTVQSGVLGRISRVYAPVGDAPHAIDYTEQPIPAGLDWDLWKGPLGGPKGPLAPDQYFYNEELCPEPGNNGWGGWRWHIGLGGGYTTDWGAHMFDCAQWALGRDGQAPTKIMAPETSPYGKLTYVYSDGVEMIQGYDTEDWNRGNSVKVIGEHGWAFASRSNFYVSNKEWSREGRDDSKMPTPAEMKAQQEEQQREREKMAKMTAEERAAYQQQRRQQQTFVAGVGQDGFERNDKHYTSFINAIKTRNQPEECPIEVGQSSSIICNIGNIAYQLHRTVYWNPVKKQFINDAEANNHYIMNYEMRDPWQRMIDNI